MYMKKVLWVAILATLVVLVVPGRAMAAPAGAPGSELTITHLAPGVDLMEVSAVASVPWRTAWENCKTYYLCLYENSISSVTGSTSGHFIMIKSCGNYDLGHLNTTAGLPWNDRATAVYNNQSSGTTAALFNYSGTGTKWDFMMYVWQGQKIGNLTDYGFNDKADGVHVCGGGLSSPWEPTSSWDWADYVNTSFL
jgi:hypothetical protein